jgi:hypothetical protein
VLVTTNAIDRIDGAFLRRFDVLLNFHLPASRRTPGAVAGASAAAHVIDRQTLARVAEACVLSGGQIRNVVLAAVSSMLAAAPARRRAPVRRPAPRIPAQRRPLSARPLRWPCSPCAHRHGVSPSRKADPRFIGVTEQIKSAAGKLKKHPPAGAESPRGVALDRAAGQ